MLCDLTVITWCGPVGRNSDLVAGQGISHIIIIIIIRTLFIEGDT